MFNKVFIYSLLSLFLYPTSPMALEPSDRLEKRYEILPKPISSFKSSETLIKDMVPPKKASEIRFILKEIQFDSDKIINGHSAGAKLNFSPLYVKYLGKEVSLSDIYSIVNSITHKYGDAGFGLSRAYLPEQKVLDGIVKIGVLEGYVEKVILEGELDNQEGYFHDLADKIMAEKPLNLNTLSRYMLIANDISGLDVKATFKKSTATVGATTLVFQGVEKGLDGVISINNEGTEASGPVQLNASINLYNVFGHLTKTNFLLAVTSEVKELNYLSFDHQIGFGLEGTILGFSATYTQSEPGLDTLELIEYNSESQSLGVYLSYPVVRSRNQNLSLDARLDVKQSVSRSLGEKITEDKLRVFRAKINYDFSDRYAGINQAIMEYSHGLDVLEASSLNDTLKSRSDGIATFEKVTLHLSRTQQLNVFNQALSNWSLYASMKGQNTGHALLSGEECGIGGREYGKAFSSSEIIGDQCLAASIEARYLLGFKSDSVQYMQAYAFLDKGEVFNKKSGQSSLESESIESIGTGIRFGIFKIFTGYLELSKPLMNKSSSDGNKDHLFNAKISYKY